MAGQAGISAESGSLLGRIGRGLAALVSLGLVLVLGLWAWRIGTQDVSQVPVILAQDGPMRVQPEDPGGTTVPHQGLEVNEVVAGTGTRPLPDEITLAPAPLEPEPVIASQPDTSSSAPEPAQDAASDTPDVAEVTGGSPRSPRSSVRPVPRPEGLGTRVAAPVVEQPVEIDASAIPDGAHMIQLGAFDSEETALLQWAGMLSAQPDLLEGKQRYIEQTTSGGRTLFRLRAVGYGSGTETRAACAALTARGLQCIPVQKR